VVELARDRHPRVAVRTRIGQAPACERRGRLAGQGTIALTRVGGMQVVELLQPVARPRHRPDAMEVVVPRAPGPIARDEVSVRTLGSGRAVQAADGTLGHWHPAVDVMAAPTFGPGRDSDESTRRRIA